MVRRRAGLVACLLGVVLVAGCATSGPELQERTRSQAVSLARQDVQRVAAVWQAGVLAALEDGSSRSGAEAAGRRAALGISVPYLTLLDETASDAQHTGELTQPVAVVHQVDGGGGWSATSETVRMCALLVVPLTSAGTPSVQGYDCPGSLPDTVPGLGTVSATVPYA